MREVHVLTHSSRPPKQIVRDVQAVLVTEFGRSIDYRIVSVAYLERGLDPGSSAESAPGGGDGAPRPGFGEARRPRGSSRGSDAPADERIRFESVNLFVSGSRTQAQVELRWRGVPRVGSASGYSTRAGAYRLVAAATLEAVRAFLAEEIALTAWEPEFLRLGRRRAVVVSISMLAGRQEKLLVGACPVEQDVQQAVVFATLGALNRVLGGLEAKEPTEYLLRPTSA